MKDEIDLSSRDKINLSLDVIVQEIERLSGLDYDANFDKLVSMFFLAGDFFRHDISNGMELWICEEGNERHIKALERIGKLTAQKIEEWKECIQFKN